MIFFIECTCDPRGSDNGDECAHNPNGDCKCRRGVVGLECNECDNGFYGADSIDGCKSKLIFK